MVVETIASLCVGGTLESTPLALEDSANGTNMDEETKLEPSKLGINETDLEKALEITRNILVQQFGPMIVDKDDPTKSKLVVDFFDVTIDHDSGTVVCKDARVRDRVLMALRRTHAVVYPIPDYYCDCCACGE